MFRHCYPGTDPDECTIAEFYALLGVIPRTIQELWGGSVDSFERVERAAVMEAIIAGPLNHPT